MSPIDDKHLMKVTPRPDVVMVKGQGSYLWDNQGRRYLDFIQGWAVNAFGHGSREMRDAIVSQAELLVTPSPAFHNAPQLELARRLTTVCSLNEAHFSSTGAEANEVAVKLARNGARSGATAPTKLLRRTTLFTGAPWP